MPTKFKQFKQFKEVGYEIKGPSLRFKRPLELHEFTPLLSIIGEEPIENRIRLYRQAIAYKTIIERQSKFPKGASK